MISPSNYFTICNTHYLSAKAGGGDLKTRLGLPFVYRDPANPYQGLYRCHLSLLKPQHGHLLHLPAFVLVLVVFCSAQPQACISVTLQSHSEKQIVGVKTSPTNIYD